jgi:polyisoprenoid-binding protein YceI
MLGRRSHATLVGCTTRARCTRALAPAALLCGLVLLPLGDSTPAGAAAGATLSAADGAAGLPSDAGSQGGGLRVTLVTDGSEARYRAREQLVGRGLPTEAVGRTRAVSGTITVDGGGGIAPGGSTVSVDLRGLQSNERRRDNFVQDETLQTSRYPTADFLATETRGLTSPLPTAGEVAFALLGDLTVHGAVRPTLWQVVARVDGSQVAGTATTRVKITDFGMELPRVAVLLSIEDALGLEVDFLGTSAPQP